MSQMSQSRVASSQRSQAEGAHAPSPGLDVHEFAEGMLEAKANVDHLSPSELIMMDTSLGLFWGYHCTPETCQKLFVQ